MLSCSFDFKPNVFSYVLQTDIRDYNAILAACEGADCVFHVASYGMSGTEQVSPNNFLFFCVTAHTEGKRLDAVTRYDRSNLFILPWCFGKLLCANWSASCKQPACRVISSPLEAPPAPWEGVWDGNGIEKFWNVVKTKGRTREAGSLQNPDPSLNLHMDLLGVGSLGRIKPELNYKLFHISEL